MTPKGRQTLSTEGLDAKQVARYLRYRVYLQDPLVVAQDSLGEFTHHGRYCPVDFTLEFPEAKLAVQVAGNLVAFKWQGDAAKVMLDYLTGDPVWGPDWSAPERTK